MKRTAPEIAARMRKTYNTLGAARSQAIENLLSCRERNCADYKLWKQVVAMLQYPEPQHDQVTS